MAPEPNRREFLRRGLQLGSLALGALATSAVLEGCDNHAPPPSTTTTTTTVARRAATPTDWQQLGSSLNGSLVLPQSPSYGFDRLLYNSKFTDLHPRGIAYCASEDDVARCVAFINSFDVDVAARSGGHSYGGYCNSDGLVIDVSRLSSIAVDTSANTATVGAGAALIDVYNVLGAKSRLLPGGSCPTVGIAGLALGGGIGVFGRKYGLTTDNIRSLRLVTPEGHTITVDDQNHADLLWASQGGGGGNFGVVTSFEFAVYPLPELTLFSLQFPWAAADTMLAAWQQWVPTTPDEVWTNCQLQSDGSYGYLAELGGVFCGSPSELDSLLAPLKTAIGTAPTYDFVGSNAYIDAMRIEAGCSSLTVAACHQAPQGSLSRTAYTAKSSYVDAPMTSPEIARVVGAIENLAAHAPTIGGALAFDSYGGAINRVAATDTAFVHRDKLACIQASYSWSSETSASEIEAGQTWLTWLGTDVFDPSSGAYQNYIDPTLTDWQAAYYGENFDRLVRIKQRYDPSNRFRFAQSIPTSKDA